MSSANTDTVPFLDRIALRPVTLYGLSKKHLTHIFESFHEGWDYEVRLEETQRHFQEWRRSKH